MSAERSPAKRRKRIGWVSMLTIGTIVVAAGFAVGIVAGVTWEEPGLVIGWLAGETDGIEWAVDGHEVSESSRIPDGALPDPALAGIPDVAAAPPLGGRKAATPPAADRDTPPPSTSVVRKKAQPRAPLPGVAARREVSSTTAETGRFSVQVGAFADRGAAGELSERLRKAGFPTYLSDSRQGARWRVRVGPHPTREAAESTAKRLEQSQQLPTWVLREDS